MSVLRKIQQSSFGRKHLTKGPLVDFAKKCYHGGKRRLKKVKCYILRQSIYQSLPKTVNKRISKAEPEYLALSLDTPVDVIIPIYNGYDYLVRLFEDILKTNVKCRYILVDDKSPDERVKELEKKFVLEHANSILIENEENYGFVKSVNNGLKASVGHVVLVNTDTELPNEWLERLMQPILKDKKVATATPYTNSGTICSFPNFGVNNEIYLDMDIDKLDSYFKLLAPAYSDMPTGVGFCMGMSRSAIDEIGYLDEESYGRGYCEENDWCQRARKKGYKNVHVDNLFVYHKHGGSFISEEKEQLIKDHLEILKSKFPSYDEQVGKYCRKDPNKDARELIQMIIDSNERHSVLYFDHSLGGGATAYLDARKEEFINKGGCVFVVRHFVNRSNYHITFENGKVSRLYEFEKLDELIALGKYIHFDEVIVNEMVYYPRLWESHRKITELAKSQGSKLIFLFHDYYAVCPTINLVTPEHKYCGLPGGEKCEACFKSHKYGDFYACSTHKEWVENWKEFLLTCDEVRTFSEDTLERAKNVFSDELKFTLVPHQVNYAYPIGKNVKREDTLNIGLIGAMSIHKGSEFIRSMMEEIDAKNLNIKVKLIGYPVDIIFKKYKCYEMTGAYKNEELPRLIYENDIDIFLIASIWPETFSYTTEEIMKMGLPIASLDMGAPAQRIRKYDKGLIIEKDDPAYAIDKIIDFATNTLDIKGKTVNYKKVIYVAEYISFSSRYRMEHLKEELLYQGVHGEVIETSDLKNDINWDEIGALVIYRCRYMEKLPAFMDEAKKHGVPILYDIDDYIYDYDSIKELPFMKDEEYKDFEEYSGLIRKCMDESDGIIVSTENLAATVRKHMPEKRVYVNRNVASAEMLVLSTKAQSKKRTNKKDVVLGYFSGSNTHSADFELISDTLLEFMKTHSNVYLKIVGCLELSKGFNGVADRIIREGFMPWQELPCSIAGVDINLMPLENTLFHRCKSENKWMEAALVKVPTIASYNDEMELATKDGENIILCHSLDDWNKGLEELVASEERRKEIAEKAFDYVLANKITLVKDEELLKFVIGYDK